MRKIIFAALTVLILAIAVNAQNTTSSGSVKSFYKANDAYVKADKVYQQYQAGIVSTKAQLQSQTLTPGQRATLEQQLRNYELALGLASLKRDEEYNKMVVSRDEAYDYIIDPGISRRLLQHAGKNSATANQRLQLAQAQAAANPSSASAQQELALATAENARALNELNEAGKLDAEVTRRNQPCENPWSCMGGLLQAYDEYKGIGQATAMFFPSYNEWTKEVRKSISQTFCGFVSIQNCFESLICGAVLDISSGNAIAGNVLFGRGSNGQMLSAGTISAERSLPIVLKGMEKELIIDVIGSELIILNNQIINISEVDTTTLPAQEVRLYKIQYSITNTHDDRELSYNLEVKGDSTRKIQPNDKKLKPGQTARQTIEAYKTTKYDEVCLTFNPSLPAGTGSTLIVAPKMVSRLCKPIVEYAGGATSVGNYANEEKENTQTGGTPGGTW